MQVIKRPISFILASTDHGTMILNRNDYGKPTQIESYFDPGPRGDYSYGIGDQILNESSFVPDEISYMKNVIDTKRMYCGDGVFVVDIGANIGTHTIEWAKHMTSWGNVLSFEAQERVFYALAGNIAINNCFNAKAILAAVGDRNGFIPVPKINYNQSANCGALELIQKTTGNVGQPVYSEDAKSDIVSMVALDACQLPRVDFIKIDVEGMEIEVLLGAIDTITKHKPIIFVEFVKSSKESVEDFLKGHGYVTFVFDEINFLAYHKEDPALMEYDNAHG